MRVLSHAAVAVVTLAVMPLSARATISFGQVDNFEDGTTMSWAEGGVSPNPPTNIATGGPAGLGDNYLQNLSSGGTGAGSRMIMFNNDQWTGDFVSAGVTRLDAMVRATGNALAVRVGILGSDGTIYVSQPAVPVPNDGAWHAAAFNLTPAGMVVVQGTGTLATVLSDVSEMRILSANAASWLGDSIVATMGFDNLTAAPEPGALSLLGIGVAGSLLRRRKSR
jgi:hypothetical protein